MDISDTLAPNSDQLDAVDLLGSPPRIFTITDVTKGGREQPVNVHLAEFPRVWRPGKTMRRVLAGCWGKQADEWIGRRVELYCDETVMYGGKPVGGVRISRMSHIDKPRQVPIIVRQGQGGSWNVDPLPDAPAASEPSPAELAAQLVAALADATTEAEVREWGNRAHARGLLTLEVDGITVDAHVRARLAEVDEEPAS